MRSLMEVFQDYKDSLLWGEGVELTDVNQRGSCEDALLHLASFRGEAEDVKVLLANGADVNIKGDLGFTPLHNAAMRNEVKVINILLASGANPYIVCEDGRTPLQVAEVSKRYGAAARLLRKRENTAMMVKELMMKRLKEK